jgi:hypothetical protein
MTSDKYSERLETWAEAVRERTTEHHRFTESQRTGIEVVLDGLCEWSYPVKVKRPWKLFGQYTREVYFIYETEIRVPLGDSSLAAELLAAEIGKPITPVTNFAHLAFYVRSFDYSVTTPEVLVENNGPPDFPFSKFSWHEDAGRLGELEKGSFVSRYIEGFEGKENELVYIYRRNNFRSSMEEDAVLDFIIPSVVPRLSIDGTLVEASETMDLLRLAVDFLPEDWE